MGDDHSYAGEAVPAVNHGNHGIPTVRLDRSQGGTDSRHYKGLLDPLNKWRSSELPRRSVRCLVPQWTVVGHVLGGVSDSPLAAVVQRHLDRVDLSGGSEVDVVPMDPQPPRSRSEAGVRPLGDLEAESPALLTAHAQQDMARADS